MVIQRHIVIKIGKNQQENTKQVDELPKILPEKHVTKPRNKKLQVQKLEIKKTDTPSSAKASTPISRPVPTPAPTPEPTPAPTPPSRKPTVVLKKPVEKTLPDEKPVEQTVPEKPVEKPSNTEFDENKIKDELLRLMTTYDKMNKFTFIRARNRLTKGNLYSLEFVNNNKKNIETIVNKINEERAK